MVKNAKLKKYPLVTLCTPTFNRRPFIPIMIKCFEHQTYPKDKIQWIIVDDGTDKIEELVVHIPQVTYIKYDEKLTIGQKRNICNDAANGEIIVYMDDDDYYPPERISHAVEMLRLNPKAMCAGSSIMHIYFKHINKMYQFGPYAAKHATAATFAFRKELLKQTRFDEDSSLAEEKKFLKDYTIPFVQLDSKKTILVFSHSHNSFDKKELLKQMPNPSIHDTDLVPSDIVKEPELLKFFLEDIDELLSKYEPGKPENKPDVAKQMIKINESRENMIKEEIKKQIEYKNTMDKIQMLSNVNQNNKDYHIQLIQDLTNENNKLKEKVVYLEEKLKKYLAEEIQKRMLEKKSDSIV
jgi:glycosyltransferase involved in cell wall biosynthesis